jgi:phage I-like protein
MKNTLIFVCKDLQGVVPEEIQVIPAGKYDTPKGTFELTQESAKEVIAYFEQQQNDMVIDYEHQTLADPPVEAPASGWIKKLVNKGADGIWAVVEWTEKARQYIANKEYKYISPVFYKRKADNVVTRLINVALTNAPNIDGMVPLINKLDMYEINENKKEVTGMKELLKLLGLTEDATEVQAIAAVNKLREGLDKETKMVANKSVLDALGLAEGASESEVTGTIMAMKQGSDQVKELATKVTTLTNKLNEKEAADCVAQAMKDGKITPAQKDWAAEYAKRDLAGFQVFIAKAPVVVIDGKIVTDQKPGENALDDTQTQINKMCGIDDETFKKYGPKDN